MKRFIVATATFVGVTGAVQPSFVRAEDVGTCGPALPRSALGRGPSITPTEADNREAAKVLKLGSELSSAGRHEDALTCFGRAHALVGVPFSGFALAAEMALLGQLLEARTLAQWVATAPIRPKEPIVAGEARVKAATLVFDLTKRIPTLAVEVTPNTLVIAGFRIDEEELPSSALGTPRDIDPGVHTIKLKMGEKERIRTVTLREGAREVIRISFDEPVIKPPTPPVLPREPQPAKPWQRDVLMASGVGLSVVGLTLGTIGGLLARSRSASARDECPNGCTQTGLDAITSGKRWGNLSTAMFLTAGAGVGLTITGVLWPLQAKSGRESRPTTLLLSPGYVELYGSF